MMAKSLEKLGYVSEDDGSDEDTVYECPGLASSSEMVVSNPFYLQGSQLRASEKRNGNGNQRKIYHEDIRRYN